MRVRHLSVALLCLTILATEAAKASPDQQDVSRYIITFQGVRVGTETVTVNRTAGTFDVSSTGQIAPPLDLVTTNFEMSYSADWQPQRLAIEGLLRNQLFELTTSFGLTTATNNLMQGGQRSRVTHDITPRTVVLVTNFFGAYAGLAARLDSFTVGTPFPVYVAPEVQGTATITRVTPRRLVGPSGALDLKQYDLTVTRAGGSIPIQLWVEANGRLARVTLRELALAAIREDLGSVMTREEKVRNPGDESVFIPASGFNLAATTTKPSSTGGKMPAVVLVGGSGRQDRDETMYGISIFGQLAGRLADAGYFVVRYDRRGVGQSGGRSEHAEIAEYAGDLIDIVAWLRKRKDIDQDRIGVIAHGEGSAVALTAAGREKKIAAVALLASPGRTGREVVLEQQQLVLARLSESVADKEAKVALQRRVIDVAISGRGWETLPPDLRRQAEVPLFRSWLLYDPAAVMTKVGQPLLIVHGELDKEVPPAHADQLEQLGRARPKPPAAYTQKVLVPGVNHLLVGAQTGEPDEYESLTSREVAPTVTAAIVDWLNGILRKPKAPLAPLPLH